MDEVDEIKRRIDIVDFISSYLTLKKAGRNYRALCPFHQEKTPSFMVSPTLQIFKCFGCGAAGDVFEFVQKMEHLEFPEALAMLADRAGVILARRKISPQEYQAQKDQKTRLYEINLWSARFFYQIIAQHPAGRQAKEYLLKRGLTQQTIEKFRLGFAPNRPSLAATLSQKGFTSSEIQKAGSPDRFYNRIIFPIFDTLDNIIAFTGRSLTDEQQPKYLNTSETILFHKSATIYGLNFAKKAVQQKDQVVLVEGQMDVICSHQAGVENVVAASGTAATLEHLRILGRYSPNLILAFDADSAGQKAGAATLDLAIEEGLDVAMVNLGDFKDPGEMAIANSSLWQKAIQEAIPGVEWHFETAFKDAPTSLTGLDKKQIASRLLPIIIKITDEIERGHWVGELARRLGVRETVIIAGLEKVKTQEPRAETAVASSQIAKPILSVEENLLGLLLWQPELQKQYPAIYKELSEVYNQDKKALLLTIQELHRGEEIVEIAKEAVEAITRLRSQRYTKIKEEFEQKIKQAETKGDRQATKDLIIQFQQAIIEGEKTNEDS